MDDFFNICNLCRLVEVPTSSYKSPTCYKLTYIDLYVKKSIKTFL